MAKLELAALSYWLLSFLILSALFSDFPTFVESVAPWPAPSPNDVRPPPPNAPTPNSPTPNNPVHTPPTPNNPVPNLPPPVNQVPGPSGLNGGQKAGVAIGVLAGSGLIVFGGLVYKKRRRNIRRSRYSYAARDTFL